MVPGTVRNGQFAPQSLRIEEFCRIYGLSRRTWSRMRKDGQGPAVTWLFGKQVILQRSIDEWIRARTEVRGHPYQLPNAS